MSQRWRWSYLGLVLAPLVGSLVFAILSALLSPVPVNVYVLLGTASTVLLFGALPASIVIGIPLVHLLRGRLPLSPLTGTLAGTAVAAATLLAWDQVLAMDRLVIPTLLAGALGGLAFWGVARREFGRAPPRR